MYCWNDFVFPASKIFFSSYMHVCIETQSIITISYSHILNVLRLWTIFFYFCWNIKKWRILFKQYVRYTFSAQRLSYKSNSIYIKSDLRQNSSKDSPLLSNTTCDMSAVMRVLCDTASLVAQVWPGATTSKGAPFEGVSKRVTHSFIQRSSLWYKPRAARLRSP